MKEQPPIRRRIRSKPIGITVCDARILEVSDSRCGGFLLPTGAPPEAERYQAREASMMLAGKNLFDLFFQCRQLVLDNIPNDLRIDAEVLMDQNVTKPCDSLPVH